MPGSTGAGWYQTGQQSSKGTLTESGGFEPDVAPVGGERLNPFADGNEEWGWIEIGGVEVPGVVQSIDGAEKPDEWQVQKGTKESNASTDWKGTKLAESIKIVTALFDANSFEQYYVLRDTLRPKLGEKPPALTIFHGAINFNGITRVSVKNIGAPKWQRAGGYWTGEIELIEFSPPKPANTGKPKGKGKDPNADVKAELDAVVKEAGAL